MMFQPRDFYSYYLVDHYLYKQAILKNLIEKYDSLKGELLDQVTDVVDRDVIRTLKIEMHFTYFQVIETMFELIFALESLDSNGVWYHLSTSKGQGNYERIAKIAEGNTEFLDRTVEPVPGLQVPFIHWLVYFGVEEVEKVDIPGTITTVKELLVRCAQDFTDRDQYNAYKHALRLMPVISGMGATSMSPGGPSLYFNLEDSFTYLHVDKKKGTMEQGTRPSDYQRDYHMSLACQCVIFNIVVSRRNAFNSGTGVRSPLNNLSVLDVAAASHQSSDISSMSFTMTIEHESSQPVTKPEASSTDETK